MLKRRIWKSRSRSALGALLMIVASGAYAQNADQSSSESAKAAKQTEAPEQTEGPQEAERAEVPQEAKAPAKLIPGPQLAGPISSEQLRYEIEDLPSAPLAKGQPDLAYGAYQRGLYLSAFKLALPRAEAGDPAAQTLLAELHMRGLGVARDREAAKQWYRFAADGGNPQAQFAYASMLLEEDRLIQAAKPTATREAEGLPGVQLDEGVEAIARPADSPKRQEARRVIEQAAAQGLPRAQFNLAQMIVEERPSFAGFEKALPLYRKAAEAGLADAQYALATLLARGRGLPARDEVQARQWLTRSALSGFPAAQVELGIWLANGRGGDARPKEALNWFERAAARGNVVAQNRLARMHAWGVGTVIDPVRAGAWHVITKRQGYSDPEMDRRFQTYSEIDRKRAIELANRVQP